MSFYAALVLFVALSWALLVTSYVNGAPKSAPWGRSWPALLSPQVARPRRPSTSCVETLLAARGGDDGKDKPETGSKASGADAYAVVKKDTMYKGRFRSIVKKNVRFPDGRIFDFDILNAHCCGSVMVFAWDSVSKTSTIVEEFAPGTEEMIIGPVAGGVEEKHGGGDGLMAGQFELEEEARLTGGQWYTLLEPHTTAPGDKYTSNRFHFFLVVDPQGLTQDQARARDHEEEIDIRSGVTMPELLDLLKQGRMTVPAALATLLAKDKLMELGLL